MADPSTSPEVGAHAVLGATHALSGAQWTLGTDAMWPDADIVVPFARRVTDGTGKIASDPVPAHLEAGYLLTDTLTTLELRDVTRDVDIDPLGAVWAAAPTGTTTRLHLLSGNPFAWATETVLGGSFRETQAVTLEQRFGIGADIAIDATARFGDVVIRADHGALTNVWTPPLATRVLDTGPFDITFSDGNGAPIPVDQLSLVVVGAPKVIQSVKGVRTVQRLPYQGVELWLADFALTAPLQTVSVDAQRLLVWAVRYRQARTVFTSPGRIVLQPGRYRLHIEGSSTAIAPTLDPPNNAAPTLPDGVPVRWHLDQEFDVAQPPTLRSYIRRCTVGDPRIFQAGTSWNPTPHGIGFPAYRGHLLAVRFASPYIDTIFATIQGVVSDAHDHSVVLDDTARAVANPEGETTALPQAVTWATVHGTSIPPDQELILPAAFPPPTGSATTQDVSVELRVGGVAVDRWTAALSRFASFPDHVAITQSSVTTAYTAGGSVEWPECATFYTVPLSLGTRLLPVDWSTPPPGWELPASLSAALPRDASDYTPAGYLRFAAATGARFHQVADDSSLAPLAGLTAVAATSSLSAVCADGDRPYALWLRTPEPVDWRRVTATIRLWHVYPDTGAPTGLARRSVLDLDVAIVPSPDATAAFLVGMLDGRPMLLPRGVVELALGYRFAQDDLAVLRRADGAASETTTLRFIQPGGDPMPAYHV